MMFSQCFPNALVRNVKKKDGGRQHSLLCSSTCDQEQSYKCQSLHVLKVSSVKSTITTAPNNKPPSSFIQFLTLPHHLDSSSLQCLGSCQVPPKAAGLDTGLKLDLSFSTWDPYCNDKNRVLELNYMFIQANEKMHWVPKFSHQICSPKLCKSTLMFTF